MTHFSDEIISAVEKTPGLTERELTDALRGPAAPQQPINKAARMLAGKGLLVRMRRPDSLMGNYPLGAEAAQAAATASKPIRNHDVDALSEDEIKKILEAWLAADGWKIEVAWGHTRGIDIDARRGAERWIIEATGPGSRQPMRVNYFIGILGETLQRMFDSTARYSIALPDLAQYRRLWARLPALAKSRTGITMIFVSKAGHVVHLSE